jgi:hypothetical protein
LDEKSLLCLDYFRKYFSTSARGGVPLVLTGQYLHPHICGGVPAQTLRTYYFPILNSMPFDLTKESWIPVVNQAWQLEEISLIELVQTWGNFREIQGT